MLNNPLFKITQGLYVLSAKDKVNNRFAGSLVDAVMMVAAKPLIICLSCINTSYTKECVEREGEFMLSILPEDVNPLVISNFGFQTSRIVDKWKESDYEMIDELPTLKGNLAVIKAKVVDIKKFESNTLFVAEVLGYHDGRDVKPITYREYQEGFKEKVFAAVKKAKES